MNEVESKIAIVTGAIRGIGKATSSRFKREGITVIETDILPDQDRNDTYEETHS
jgi:NADP-dependent 3-hydroxy acid dehydrogenase YdfG